MDLGSIFYSVGIKADEASISKLNLIEEKISRIPDRKFVTISITGVEASMRKLSEDLEKFNTALDGSKKNVMSLADAIKDVYIKHGKSNAAEKELESIGSVAKKQTVLIEQLGGAIHGITNRNLDQFEGAFRRMQPTIDNNIKSYEMLRDVIVGMRNESGVKSTQAKSLEKQAAECELLIKYLKEINDLGGKSKTLNQFYESIRNSEVLPKSIKEAPENIAKEMAKAFGGEVNPETKKVIYNGMEKMAAMANSVIMKSGANMSPALKEAAKKWRDSFSRTDEFGLDNLTIKSMWIKRFEPMPGSMKELRDEIQRRMASYTESNPIKVNVIGELQGFNTGNKPKNPTPQNPGDQDVSKEQIKKELMESVKKLTDKKHVSNLDSALSGFSLDQQIIQIKKYISLLEKAKSLEDKDAMSLVMDFGNGKKKDLKTIEESLNTMEINIAKDRLDAARADAKYGKGDAVKAAEELLKAQEDYNKLVSKDAENKKAEESRKIDSMLKSMKSYNQSGLSSSNIAKIETSSNIANTKEMEVAANVAKETAEKIRKAFEFAAAREKKDSPMQNFFNDVAAKCRRAEMAVDSFNKKLAEIPNGANPTQAIRDDFFKVIRDTSSIVSSSAKIRDAYDMKNNLDLSGANSSFSVIADSMKLVIDDSKKAKKAVEEIGESASISADKLKNMREALSIEAIDKEKYFSKSKVDDTVRSYMLDDNPKKSAIDDLNKYKEEMLNISKSFKNLTSTEGDPKAKKALKDMADQADESVKSIDALSAKISRLKDPAKMLEDEFITQFRSVGAKIDEVATRSFRMKEVYEGAQLFSVGGINIGGPGTSTSDSIKALLSKGESVLTADATKKFEAFLNLFNAIGNGSYDPSQVIAALYKLEKLTGDNSISKVLDNVVKNSSMSDKDKSSIMAALNRAVMSEYTSNNAFKKKMDENASKAKIDETVRKAGYKINELNAERDVALSKGKSTESIDAIIAKYSQLIKLLENAEKMNLAGAAVPRIKAVLESLESQIRIAKKEATILPTQTASQKSISDNGNDNARRYFRPGYDDMSYFSEQAKLSEQLRREEEAARNTKKAVDDLSESQRKMALGNLNGRTIFSGIVDTSAQKNELELLKNGIDKIKADLANNPSYSFFLSVLKDIDATDKEITRAEANLKALKDELANSQFTTLAAKNVVQYRHDEAEKELNALKAIKAEQQDRISPDASPALKSMYETMGRIDNLESQHSTMERTIKLIEEENALTRERLDTIETLKKEIISLEAEYDKLKAGGNAKNADGSYTKEALHYIESRIKAEDKLKAITETLTEAQREKIKSDLENERNIRKLQNEYDRATRSYERYKASIDRDSSIGKDVSAQRKVLEKYADTIKKIQELGLSRNVSTENLDKMKKALADINSEMSVAKTKDSLSPRNLGIQWRNAASGVDSFGGSIKSVMDQATSLRTVFNSLGTAIENAFTTFGLQQFTMNVINIGGELEKQQLAMGAILQDAAKADKIFSQVSELSMISPFDVQDLVKNTKLLSAFGIQYDDLYDTTRRLSDIAAALGVDFQRIAYEFGQTSARGWLDARELRMFANSGIPLLQKLSDLYTRRMGENVSAGQVRKMISNREVSFEDVKKVMWDMTDEGGNFFNMQQVMAESLAATWRNMLNEFNLMYGEIAKSGFGDWLKSAIKFVTELAKEWKSLITISGVYVGTLFIIKSILNGVSSLTNFMASSTIRQHLAQKALNATLLEAQSKYGVLSAAEAHLVATKTKLTAADYMQLIAEKKLTRTQAVRAVLMSTLNAREKKLMLTTMGLSAAQIKFVRFGTLSSGMMGMLSRATIGLRLSLVSLFKFLVANWWVAAAAAIAGVVAICVTAYRRANELKRKLAEINDDFNVKFSADLSGFNLLMNRLKELNGTSKERSELIAKINDQYGEYLGKLISEADSYDEIEAAAKRATEAIRAKHAADAVAASSEAISKNYSEARNKISITGSDFENLLGYKYKNKNSKDWNAIAKDFRNRILLGQDSKIITDAMMYTYGIDVSLLFNGTKIIGSDLANNVKEIIRLFDAEERALAKVYKGYNTNLYSEQIATISKYYDGLASENEGNLEVLKSLEKQKQESIQSLFQEGFVRLGERGFATIIPDLSKYGEQLANYTESSLKFVMTDVESKRNELLKKGLFSPVFNEYTKKAGEEIEKLSAQIESPWQKVVRNVLSVGLIDKFNKTQKSQIVSSFKIVEENGSELEYLTTAAKKVSNLREEQEKWEKVKKGNEEKGKWSKDEQTYLDNIKAQIEIAEEIARRLGIKWEDFGSKKGKKAESMMKDIQNLRKAYEEYKKFYTMYGQIEGLNRWTETDRYKREFKDVKINDILNFRQALQRYYDKFSSMGLKEEASQVSDIIVQFDLDIDDKKARISVSELKEFISKELEQWNVFKSLFESGMGRDEAIVHAFGDMGSAASRLFASSFSKNVKNAIVNATKKKVAAESFDYDLFGNTGMTKSMADYIKEKEGLKLTAYRLKYKKKNNDGTEEEYTEPHLTIGYGYYDSEGKLGLVEGVTKITKQKAEELFEGAFDEKGFTRNLDKFVDLVEENGHSLTQDMYDALMDIMYNTGGGDLYKSALGKAIIEDPYNFEKIGPLWKKFKANTKANIARRAETFDIYSGNKYGVMAGRAETKVADIVRSIDIDTVLNMSEEDIRKRFGDYSDGVISAVSEYKNRLEKVLDEFKKADLGDRLKMTAEAIAGKEIDFEKVKYLDDKGLQDYAKANGWNNIDTVMAQTLHGAIQEVIKYREEQKKQIEQTFSEAYNEVESYLRSRNGIINKYNSLIASERKGANRQDVIDTLSLARERKLAERDLEEWKNVFQNYGLDNKITKEYFSSLQKSIDLNKAGNDKTEIDSINAKYGRESLVRKFDDWKDSPYMKLIMSNIDKSSRSGMKFLEDHIEKISNELKNLPTDKYEELLQIQEKLFSEKSKRKPFSSLISALKDVASYTNALKDAEERLNSLSMKKSISDDEVASARSNYEKAVAAYNASGSEEDRMKMEAARSAYESAQKRNVEITKDVADAEEDRKKRELDLSSANERLFASAENLKESFDSLGSSLSKLGSAIGGSSGEAFSLAGDLFSSYGEMYSGLKSMGSGGMSAFAGYIQFAASIISTSKKLSEAVHNIQYSTYEHYAKKQKEVNDMVNAVNDYAEALLRAKHAEENWFSNNTATNIKQASEDYYDAARAYRSAALAEQEVYQNKQSSGWGNYAVAGLAAAAAVVAAIYTGGAAAAAYGAIASSMVPVAAAAGATAATALSIGTATAMAALVSAGATLGVALAAGADALIQSFTYGEGMTAAMNNLVIETKKVDNGVWGTGWGGSNQKTQNLYDWLKEVGDMSKEYRETGSIKSTGSMMAFGIKSKNQKLQEQFAKEAAKAGINDFDLFDENGLVNVELVEALLANETLVSKLQGETKDTLELLKANAEKINEARESIREAVSEWYSPIVQNMTDGLWDWFDNGVNALDSFRKAATSTFRDIATSMIQSLMMNDIFDSYSEQLENATLLWGSGNMTNDAYVQTVAALTGDAVSIYNDKLPMYEEMLSNIDEALGAYGISLKESDSSAMSSSISGMTEETADIMAAYINGIRGDLSMQRYIVESIGTEMLPHMSATADAQLAQLNIQTEYLRVISERVAGCEEHMDALRSDIHAVTLGEKSFSVS